MKIYVVVVQELKKKETSDETHVTTKIGGKTSLSLLISFCKIFIPSYAFDALFLHERIKAIHEKTHVLCLFTLFFEKILNNNYFE